MTIILDWRDDSRFPPEIIVYLDEVAAEWLLDALESHDPKDGATKQLRDAIIKGD